MGDKKDKKEKKKEKEKKDKNKEKDIKEEKEDMPKEIPDVRNKPNLQLLCKFHNEDLQLYCFSCKEVICKYCAIYGPHNNQLHNVNNINIPLQSNYTMLTTTISNDIISKRDLLISNMIQLKNISKELEANKNNIERITSEKFNKMLDNLKSEEQKNISILQTDIAILYNEIEEIKKIEKLFYNKDLINKIDFLLNVKNIEETIETLITKNFKSVIKISPEVLPRELMNYRNKINKENILKEQLRLKNKIIYDMIEYYKLKVKDIEDDFRVKTEIEITEWSKIVDKYSNELKKFQKICFFCSDVLSSKTINKYCKINTKENNIDPEFIGFTKVIPKSKYFNTGNHYFDSPRDDLFTNGMAYKNLQAILDNKKTLLTLQNSIMRELYSNIYKIKNICNTNNIDIEAMIKQHDAKSIGIISKIKFNFILYENIGVSQEIIDNLLCFLDPKNKGLISISEFFNIYKNPNVLEEYLNIETNNPEKKEEKNN